MGEPCSFLIRGVVGEDGGSKKLWEMPEDCFGLGWIWVANNTGNECRSRAGLNLCSGKNGLKASRPPLAIKCKISKKKNPKDSC